MKKILFLNTVFIGGGAAQIARDLFKYANRNGFDAYFAYGRGEKINNQKLFKFGLFIETLAQIFLVRFFGLEGFGCFFSTMKLIKFIKKNNFDLIHIHNLHGYYLNIYKLIKFLEKSKIPVIWTMHDEWPLSWLPAHTMNCEHCKTLKGKCSNLYPYPKCYFKLFSKYTSKKKQKALSGNWDLTIVCPADWLADNFRKSFLNKFIIRTVANGINIDIFKPLLDKSEVRVKYHLPVDKKIIVFSANDFSDKNKGICHIINVAKDFNNKDYLFLGIGKGNFKNSENIKFFGRIDDRSEYREILALSDIYCFTSRVETQPLAVIEALSCGLPVIAFDIIALQEIIDPACGSLVDFGDEKRMAQEIDKILVNDFDRNIKSKNARIKAVDEYSQDKFFLSYHDAYLKKLQ